MKKHIIGWNSITKRIVLILVLLILPFNIVSIVTTMIQSYGQRNYHSLAIRLNNCYMIPTGRHKQPENRVKPEGLLMIILLFCQFLSD